MTLPLTQLDVERKYNIPIEFPIRITLFGQTGTGGIFLPLGDYDYDFLTVYRSSKSVFPLTAMVHKYTKLTIYSEPNGLGSFKIYKNPSEKMMRINFPKDFFIKSFSVDSLIKSDYKYAFVNNTFSNSATQSKHYDSNTSYFLLIIFFIIILYSAYKYYKS